ncbi:MAG: hypothetical protein ACE5LA_06710 [Dehalococcoidales bacterium]
MPRCPNCGQETARTEDWACQLCGYPLLSKAYKKVPKTYRELQEEKQYKTYEPEWSARKEPEPALEPEPEPVLEPAPELEAEQISEPEPMPQLKPAPKLEAEQISEPELIYQPEPAPELEAEPEPLSPAMEITAGELLSAYEKDGDAADKRFANKVLRVTGIVNRIEAKDTLNIFYITLTDTQKTILLGDVRCFFDRKHGHELNSLALGQTVTVQGKYDGSMINIRMSNCFLVH